MNQIEPIYLTVKEVAERFRFGPDVIQRAAQRGDLPGVRCGKEWRFSKQEIKSRELAGKLW